MTGPSGATQPTIYVPQADGARRVVPGTAVVAAFGDGRELHCAFSHHPASDGGLMIRSEYVKPGTKPPPRVPRGPLPDVIASIQIHPGASNIMQLTVEAHARTDGGLVVAAGAEGPDPALFAVANDERSAIGSNLVVMDFGNGSDVTVEIGTGPDEESAGRKGLSRPGWVAFLAGPAMTRADYETMRSGGAFASSSLHVSFGAANVVHAVVVRHEGMRMPRDWPKAPPLAS